jgi:hypothetical protein
MLFLCILCLTYVSAAAVLDDEPQESAEDAAQERLAWEQAHSVLPWELATDDDAWTCVVWGHHSNEVPTAYGLTLFAALKGPPHKFCAVLESVPNWCRFHAIPHQRGSVFSQHLPKSLSCCVDGTLMGGPDHPACPELTSEPLPPPVLPSSPPAQLSPYLPPMPSPPPSPLPPKPAPLLAPPPPQLPPLQPPPPPSPLPPSEPAPGTAPVIASVAASTRLNATSVDLVDDRGEHQQRINEVSGRSSSRLLLLVAVLLWLVAIPGACALPRIWSRNAPQRVSTHDRDDGAENGAHDGEEDDDEWPVPTADVPMAFDSSRGRQGREISWDDGEEDKLDKCNEHELASRQRALEHALDDAAAVEAAKAAQDKARLLFAVPQLFD